MTHPNTTRLATRLRLLCGLALLIGLCALTGGLTRPAHAQTKLKVTTCSSDAQLRAEVAQANTDNASDVITFACSGNIKLSSTLNISGSMTLDGSGQSVTLDGGDSVQILYVNSGVTFTLKTLTIAHGSANSAPDGLGGGLENIGGTVSISNSTFSGNSASGDAGGGLYNNYTLSISNSTFSGNSATNGEGGGLDNSSGTVSISNSTFSGNSATNGALFNFNGGTVSISNSTFSGNSASSGALFNFNGTVNIGGSIVANNTEGNCSGGVSDQGYNLSSDSSCGFTAPSVQNTNPKLGPLASNGGRTQTMALLKGSPASDSIPLSSSLCPATDQRGHKRPDSPQESACDFGAYES